MEALRGAQLAKVVAYLAKYATESTEAGFGQGQQSASP
jgi:hypothetical protein